MSIRAPQDDMYMGPPTPMKLRIPADSNEIPAYFVVAALGLVVLFGGAASLVHDHETPLVSPVVAWGGAVLLSLLPLLLLAKAVAFVKEGRRFDFGTEVLHISRQWLFGKPIRVRYDQIVDIAAPRNARVLTFADGSRLRLSAYTAMGHWWMAALELRIGYARERLGDRDSAFARYEAADYYFDPSLDARKASVADADEDPDEVLELHLGGLVEHEAAFGSDSEQAALLRERLVKFQEAHPKAEASGSRAVRSERAPIFPRIPPPWLNRTPA